MLLKTLSVAAILLLMPCRQALATDGPTDRETLRGVKAMSVVIEDLQPAVERDGLTVVQLQTDVELRLRQSGILVENGARSVYLYVVVNALFVCIHP